MRDEAKVKLKKPDFGTLAICAVRYCMGRQTYMPELVRDIIRPHLQEMTDRDIAVMLSDCDFQRSCDAYGDVSIDKPGWLKWERELTEERWRRDETGGTKH